MTILEDGRLATVPFIAGLQGKIINSRLGQIDTSEIPQLMDQLELEFWERLDEAAGDATSLLALTEALGEATHGMAEDWGVRVPRVMRDPFRHLSS